MGLLASMGAGMDCQGRALNKAFCTIWKAAAIRSFVRMYSKMSAQIRFSVESLVQKHNNDIRVNQPIPDIYKQVM